MKPTLTLSRAMLDSFRICQRRFQLRYLEAVPWPALSLEPEAEKARDLGSRFHQMLNRHFLCLPVTAGADIEPELDRWWKLFLERQPSLPDGRRYPELTLTIPVAGHFVVGRLDLLIIADGQAHIFDWKTSARPRETEILRLVAKGYSNKEIAEKLVVSLGTVHSSRSKLMSNLGLNSRRELIQYACDRGMLRDFYENPVRLPPHLASLFWLTLNISREIAKPFGVFLAMFGDFLDAQIPALRLSSRLEK